MEDQCGRNASKHTHIDTSFLIQGKEEMHE
uniref:Uncharacterized protein n=1 Tax=Arundo donax TaxID=35708 RepID=A0A0A9CUE8_ARUDO